MVADAWTPGALAGRLADCEARMRQQRPADALRDRLSRGCWIYGAGGYGLRAARLLEEAGLPVRGLVDRRAADPAFRAAQTVPAIAPEAMTRAMAAGATLVVGVHNFAADPAPIHAWAAALGFGEVIVPAELPDVLGSSMGGYWLTGWRRCWRTMRRGRCSRGSPPTASPPIRTPTRRRTCPRNISPTTYR